MKKISIAVSLVVLFLFMPLAVCVGGEWYEGGTLHDATISQWKTASDADKLATAADWAMARRTIKVKVTASGSKDTLKTYANELLKCINAKAETLTDGNIKASKVAKICMIVLKW